MTFIIIRINRKSSKVNKSILKIIILRKINGNLILVYYTFKRKTVN